MTTDYLSRITPPVCEQEPGSVYDRIMTAIHMSRKRNRNDFTGLIFKVRGAKRNVEKGG